MKHLVLAILMFAPLAHAKNSADQVYVPMLTEREDMTPYVGDAGLQVVKRNGKEIQFKIIPNPCIDWNKNVENHKLKAEKVELGTNFHAMQANEKATDKPYVFNRKSPGVYSDFVVPFGSYVDDELELELDFRRPGVVEVREITRGMKDTSERKTVRNGLDRVHQTVFVPYTGKASCPEYAPFDE